MDSSVIIQLIILILLLCTSAFFSSAETSMTTVNKIRIQGLAEQGDPKAMTLLKVIEDSGKMLSAVLIGNNIANLSASALSTSLTIRLFGNVGVGIATGILTLLILIFGEITPKTLAAMHAEAISLSYAKAIYGLMVILTPLIFIVNKLSLGVLFLFRIDPHAKGSTMTEHELRTLVDVSHEDGVIETEERQMIYNVFDFGDSQAKDVMIPRIDVTFADSKSTYKELVEIFREDKYTRLPVYENTTDNVIGIVNIKDLLLIDSPAQFSIQDVLREAYFTFEYKSTSELLMEMRSNSINFAVVLDEYGATAGLITLEDLLEEIVGEIRDEYDDQEEEDLTEIVRNREYISLGSTKLDDINEVFGTHIESEDYDSIGGYIIEQLDRFPDAKESITTEENIRLVVDRVEKNRIELVHIYLPTTEDTASTTNEQS